MMKKRVLIASYNMIVGGSTTALIGLLNAFDTTSYDVDLILYKNEGRLFDFIPSNIHILPEAFTCNGKLGGLRKRVQGILSGYLLKARIENLRIKKRGMSQQILYDFQVNQLSRKIDGHYDIAIGFLEGWADRYIASTVDADVKVGWLHSTFSKIGTIPKLEIAWMDKVDKIAVVAQSCAEDFVKTLPQYRDKTFYIPNIIDANYIRTRALEIDAEDMEYKHFAASKKFKIISVCRLSIETKGLDRMIVAAEKLMQDGYSFVWYVIGEGLDRVAIEKMIIQRNLQEYFILAGVRTNPYPFLKAANIMCMASRWEGMPSTVTEAKILGVPSVVTEYLSAREQIEQNIEGIIVDNNDDSIEDGLRWCLDNESELNRMREYLLSKNYGNDKTFHQIENILFERETKDER